MKFKINTWYEITDQLGQKLFIFVDKIISDTEVVFDGEIYNFEGLYLKDCEVQEWEPDKSEYCWFISYDKEEYYNPTLGKFGGMSPDGPYIEGNLYTKIFGEIEPFREDLPYYLKLKDYEESKND